MDAEIKGLKRDEHGAILVDREDIPHSDFVNLQLVLVTSSMDHEYTRKAFEQCKSYDKQQEFLARMAELKSLYFNARDKLASYYPDRLKAIESELQIQKQVVLSEGYVLH